MKCIHIFFMLLFFIQAYAIETPETAATNALLETEYNERLPNIRQNIQNLFFKPTLIEKVLTYCFPNYYQHNNTVTRKQKNIANNLPFLEEFYKSSTLTTKKDAQYLLYLAQALLTNPAQPAWSLYHGIEDWLILTSSAYTQQQKKIIDSLVLIMNKGKLPPPIEKYRKSPEYFINKSKINPFLITTKGFLAEE